MCLMFLPDDFIMLEVYYCRLAGLRYNHSSIECFVMNQILSNLVCSVDVIVVRINFQLQLWALIISFHTH